MAIKKWQVDKLVVEGDAEKGNSTGGSKQPLPDVGVAKPAKAMPTVPVFNTTATAKPTVSPMPEKPTYDTTRWDDTEKGQAALGDYNTAKDRVNNYGSFTYGDYEESDAVKGAGTALQDHLANKPGEYKSQWQSQLDSLMQQIMNGEEFSYDMNGDALYQQYKDKFTQQGKMAMADTMGQAAAMNGGYGSSYAQSVGQQAYQGQLSQLNDIIPELAQMAYNRFRDGRQDLYNQYGMVADRESQDYGRHRDSVGDWQADRGYLASRYDAERDIDYGRYVDDRNLAHSVHQEGYQQALDALGIAQGDYYSGADMHQSEQANRNSIEGQKFSDAMSLWGAETDEAWRGYEADESARQDANALLQQGYQNDLGAWEAEQAQDRWQTEFDADQDWRDKQHGLSERELDMREEAWEIEKKDAGYNNAAPTQTKNTNAFTTRYSKEKFLARGGKESEWLDYIEGEIAGFLRNDRINEEEALYLIQYYGLK